MSTTAAKVVFWDFDGTLASRTERWAGALIAALTETNPGHELTANAVRPGLRDGFLWHTPDVAHLHLGTSARWWKHHLALFEHAYRLAGVEAISAASAATAVREAFLDRKHWSVFPDTRPALCQLKASGWRHIVVSNHVPELADLIVELGLDDLIEQTLTSAITGYEKPHPEMFRIALEVADHPSQVWMVGDNPVADVGGAETAGIPAILVRNDEGDSAPPDLLAAAQVIMERDSVG